MNQPSSSTQERSRPAGVPLRQARLASVLQGSPISPASFLADFQRTTDADVLELLAASGGNDTARVRQLAHRMEGAAMVIGAEPFADACAALAASCAGDAADCRRALEVFLARKQVLYAWIRARHPAAAHRLSSPSI